MNYWCCGCKDYLKEQPQICKEGINCEDCEYYCEESEEEEDDGEIYKTVEKGLKVNED